MSPRDSYQRDINSIGRCVVSFASSLARLNHWYFEVVDLHCMLPDGVKIYSEYLITISSSFPISAGTRLLLGVPCSNRQSEASVLLTIARERIVPFVPRAVAPLMRSLLAIIMLMILASRR
jgi:hypothetical protein